MSTLPAETAPTELELALIENEPPGLFPQNQDSYYGQFRKVVGDKLQEIADTLGTYYLDQSATTVTLSGMDKWEELLGIAVNAGGRSLDARRSFVRSRRIYGPFTRTRRRNIVESFIIDTFGAAPELTPEGIALDAGGVPLFSDVTSLTGTYNIVENIGAFSYDVRILNTIAVDQAGLQRELARVTPAGLTFTITMTATP